MKGIDKYVRKTVYKMDDDFIYIFTEYTDDTPVEATCRYNDDLTIEGRIKYCCIGLDLDSMNATVIDYRYAPSDVTFKQYIQMVIEDNIHDQVWCELRR